MLATGVLAAEVTLDHLALECAKRVRPSTIGTSGPVEARFAFRRYSLQIEGTWPGRFLSGFGDVAWE